MRICLHESTQARRSGGGRITKHLEQKVIERRKKKRGGKERFKIGMMSKKRVQGTGAADRINGSKNGGARLDGFESEHGEKKTLHITTWGSQKKERRRNGDRRSLELSSH